MINWLIWFILVLLAHQTVGRAQGHGLAIGAAAPEASPSPAAQEPAPIEPLVVTHHALELNAQRLTYTATAGHLRLDDAGGKPKAQLFFVAYTQEPLEDRSRRPLTFAFNGGPGASSIWLHLGVLGPKRVPLAEAGHARPPAPLLVDNTYSWLPFTDLVFIDPVGTGYSRPAPGEDPQQFYGVQEDIRWVSEFIRLYTTRYQRWGSPKFLAGESYGTFRAAGLAEHLLTTYGMPLTGLVLVSPALDFHTFRFQPGNDLPYCLFLPSYAAAAWYHHQSPPEGPGTLAQRLTPVEHWALTACLPALAQGDALPEAERRQVIETLARYTGLPEAEIAQHQERITDQVFSRTLLRPNGRRLALFDSRISTAEPQVRSPGLWRDPGVAWTIGPFVVAWQEYVRHDLQFISDRSYEFFSTEASEAWRWGSSLQGSPNMAERLRQALQHNPALHVWLASGYYDLATPYFAARHTANHLGLEPGARQRVTMAVYEAGHQIYLDGAALHQFTHDAAQFIGAALAISRP
jgi:carboxypeptidase C (cathepsin A)